MILTPARLPRIRMSIEQCMKRIVGEEQRCKRPGSENEQITKDAFKLVLDRIKVSELYLVTEKMRDVALDAARDVPSMRVDDVKPYSSGIIAFSGGLPEVETRVGSVKPTVRAWSSDSRVCIFTLWAHESDSVLEPAKEYTVGGGWFQVALTQMPLDDRVDLDGVELTASSVRMLSLALATWTMMEIPTVSEVMPSMELGLKTGHSRRREAPREVKTIDLRRLIRKPLVEDDGDGDGRLFTHQWVVRGHWRQQAHGPEMSLRRTTWVPSYIKGPDNAPFLPSETVFVWRR